MLKVRPAVPETDFRRLAEIITATWLEPVDESTLHEWEARTFEGQVRRRFTATRGDEVVGYGVSVHESWSPPGRFDLWVGVEGERRSAGIGSALYEAALTFAHENGATSLSTEVLSDEPESVRFAEKRGFHIDRQLFESHLVVAEFDEAPYAGLIERLEREGIRFFSLADQDKPEIRRGLYEVNRATALDIPGNNTDFPKFDEFSRIVFPAKWFFPDGQILAADDDRVIGLAALGHHPERDYMYNEMTGVLPEYRGRGLALALKLLAIRVARARGVVTLRTNNDSENAPMLRINRKLGYRPQPGYYKMVKDSLD